MSIEVILWGVIPAALAVAEISTSLFLAVSTRRLVQILLSIVVTLACVWSLLVLYCIFIRGAWPTCLPHIVIGFAAIPTFIQLFTKPKANKRDKA